MTVNVVVDLTGTLGPVRDQGARGTCLAFALSELHRHKHGFDEMLSPEYLYRAAAAITPSWQPMGGIPLSAGVSAVAAPGQPKEAHCPYQPSEPSEIPPAIPFGSYPLYSSPGAQMRVSVAHVTASIKGGKPIGLVLKLTGTFFLPLDGLVTFPAPLAATNAVHAVVAAGLGAHSVIGPCVLIRNSWGETWGEKGNAWLPTSYVQQHGLSMFEVI
jgi:hypothetical protein